jgi:hypothetical protein
MLAAAHHKPVKHIQAGILAAFTVFIGTTVAHAHIKLKAPTPQSANNPLKDAPCGPSASSRGTTMTMFASGQKITVEWTETIQHPGHYRIAFDDDGQDFPDPMSFTDIATEKKDLGKGVIVLADGIMDMTGRNAAYTAEVTLPDIECTNCTLQLIQVMTDKSPYGNGDDIYHECANLVLKKGAGAAAGSGGSAAAGTGAAGTGAAGTAAAGTGAALGAAGTASAGGGALAGAAGGMTMRPAGGAGAGAGAGAAGSVGSLPSPALVAGAAASAGTAATSAAAPSSGDGGCAVVAVGAERGSAVVVGVLAVFVVAVGRRRRSRA